MYFVRLCLPGYVAYTFEKDKIDMHVMLHDYKFRWTHDYRLTTSFCSYLLNFVKGLRSCYIL